jgi:hypothetical protein
MQIKKPPFFSIKGHSKKLIASVIIACICVTVLSGYILGSLTVQKQLPSNVTVSGNVAMSLYPDSTTTTELLLINWGTINPSQTLTFPLYIQNDAGIRINLTLTTLNWNVAASTAGLSFSYEQAGVWSGIQADTYPILDPGKRLPIILSLSASASATPQAITFTVIIQGDAI